MQQKFSTFGNILQIGWHISGSQFMENTAFPNYIFIKPRLVFMQRNKK